MKILIACEESQTICKEMRARGHWAFSCDLQPCSGGHPEWHIMGDATSVMNGRCLFTTEDGCIHYARDAWDLIIAHPPCTYLARSGQRWCNESVYGSRAVERKAMRQEAIEFFMQFVNADCERIAIENPIGVMAKEYRQPDQVVQPWMWGDPHIKSTCWWTKGLPLLVPDISDEPPLSELRVRTYTDRRGREHREDIDFARARYLDADERRRVRSKTYCGMARAIAEQWTICH